MKRFLSILLALITITLLASCSTVKPADERVVLTLDNEKIYYDYYRYTFLNTKRDMDGGDDTYWKNDPEAEKELKEEALAVMLHYRAIQRLAKEYGVKLTKEQKKAIQSNLELTKTEMGGEEAFRKSLEEAYMTEYTLLYVQELTQLWSDLYDHMTNKEKGAIPADKATVDADIPLNFRRIRYVYLEKDTENPEATAEEAQRVYDAAAAGEDFDGLIRKHGDDVTMLSLIEGGYYYTLGAIDETVQNAVEALKEGEIAPVIEVSYGYYVVQRLPLEQDYIDKNYEDFRLMYRARVFNEMLEAEAKKIAVSYSDLYHTLTVETVK